MPEYPDELCTRCGICCYMPVQGEHGRLYYTPFHCPYLDTQTKLCKVYACRFEQASWEVTVPEAIRLRQLPNGCPYLEGRPRYQGPLPDYAKSAKATRIVNEILRDGPIRIEGNNSYYRWRGRELGLDPYWMPQTTTYSLPKLADLL